LGQESEHGHPTERTRRREIAAHAACRANLKDGCSRRSVNAGAFVLREAFFIAEFADRRKIIAMSATIARPPRAGRTDATAEVAAAAGKYFKF
jgi:hypothetical protein